MSVRLKEPYQYVIDSSALFDLKDQYPQGIFPGVWERFNEMVDQKLIIAPREVYREIRQGNDELLAWADDHLDNFLVPCDEELNIVQDLMKDIPEQMKTKYGTRPWADPFVIACAKHYKITIIQHETLKQYHIPYLASKFDLECIRLVGFFKGESWTF